MEMKKLQMEVKNLSIGRIKKLIVLKLLEDSIIVMIGAFYEKYIWFSLLLFQLYNHDS
jgi:hypothetical protein